MPIFNLLDVSVKDNNRNLDLAKSSNYVGDYSTSSKRYPIDVGTSSDKGHYMIFHINVQKKTQYASEESSDVPTIFATRAKLANRVGTSTNLGSAAGGILTTGTEVIRSGVKFAGDRINSLIGNTEDLQDVKDSAIVNSISEFTSGVEGSIKEASSNLSQTGFLRTIKRTKDTIALYMPDTLAFTQAQNYGDVAFGGGLLAAGAAGVSALNKFKGKSAATIAKEVGKNMAPFLAAALQDPQLKALATGAFGTVVNPQLEMVYTAPEFRSFSFDFMFYPRSEKEAKEVQEIIRLLKFHQAPEVLSSKFAGGIGGFFLVPPSEFDIQFYYNGRENPNIPKISTCALTNMAVDYSPTGFAAYETLNSRPTMGGTGMPVAIRLTLQFRELEILTKSNFESAEEGLSDSTSTNSNAP